MKETPVRTNIVANFAGKAWGRIIMLVFIPLYIKFMGIEAYGLIGIFMSLMALFSILDMGLSTTLSRELARLSSSPQNAQESRNLVRTLEFVYWGVGIFIGLLLLTIAPFIAHYWVKPQGIPIETVEKALKIMGLIVAFQWPSSLYDGGLMGLQRQVLLNTVRGIMATIQHAGAILVLWLISPSILAYFTWQIFTSIIQTFLLAYFVWTSLPTTSGKSTFHTSLLKKNWRFAAGMTSISIMAIILTQTDKIILSKILTLTTFGYYMLAFNIANTISQLASPVFSALFPKLSQLIEGPNNAINISNLYHNGCQLVSIIVLPVACILVFFPKQILLLWVSDPLVAENTHILLSLLVIGSTLNAFMLIPLSVQLAFGWTRLSFLKNVIATIVLIPLMLYFVSLYGAIGAAIVWIILNAGYFLIEIPIMHSKILKHDMWQWYVKDVGVPLIITFSIVYMSSIFMPFSNSSYFIFIWIIFTGIFSLFLSLIPASFTKEWLKKANII